MKKKILEISKNLNSKFFFDYEIYKYTWFRTGGIADCFCLVNDENELVKILNQIDNIPYFIIGAGSNLLVRDGGFKGLIIKLGKNFNKIEYTNNNLTVGASILDINLSKFALSNSIKNFEFFSGIPGSIGGAIKMNAGCFNSETKDFLRNITVINNLGQKKMVNSSELQFSYRESNLEKTDIVISAEFEVQKGEKEEIQEKLNKIKYTRENTQPIKFKTSGSTFKNPKDYYAAKLIEESGCKGLKNGGAIISDIHSNFIINFDNATSTDIENLGKIIIEKVYKKFGITLDWEIKIIGDLVN